MQGIFCENMQVNCIGHIMAEIYKDKIYAPFMKKDMTILELGGNVGIVTLYFSQFAKHVYVVEPSKKHLKCLRKMVKFNKLNNVTVIPCALDATDGKKRFYHTEGNSTMHTLKPAWETKTSELVECLSMTTLLERYKIDTIDFMKLDVEGSEVDIMQSKSFQKEYFRIKSLIVEHHCWCGYPLEALEALLIKYGYKYRLLQTDAPIFYAELNSPYLRN